MSIAEASFTGTVRIILILLCAWWVVRLIMRLNGGPGRKRGMHMTDGPQRPKGEVNIENIPPPDRSGAKSNGNITDADFEEIK